MLAVAAEVFGIGVVVTVLAYFHIHRLFKGGGKGFFMFVFFYRRMGF